MIIGPFCRWSMAVFYSVLRTGLEFIGSDRKKLRLEFLRHETHVRNQDHGPMLQDAWMQNTTCVIVSFANWS